MAYYGKHDKRGQVFRLAPFSVLSLHQILHYQLISERLNFTSLRDWLLLQATRYTKGGAESSEHCDEKLNDVLPYFFLDSHNSKNLSG